MFRETFSPQNSPDFLHCLFVATSVAVSQHWTVWLIAKLVLFATWLSGGAPRSISGDRHWGQGFRPS